LSAPYPHIACCLERSAASERALAEARRLRALGPGPLSIVHVLEGGIATLEPQTVAYTREYPTDLARWLQETAREEWEHPVLLEHEHPARAVCEWAREARPDAIVAAAHRGALERLMVGSFAGYLAYHAPCPVILVPVPRRG